MQERMQLVLKMICRNTTSVSYSWEENEGHLMLRDIPGGAS